MSATAEATQSFPSLPGMSHSGNRKTVRTITVTNWAAGVSLFVALGLGVFIGNSGGTQPASASPGAPQIGTAVSITAPPASPGK